MVAFIETPRFPDNISYGSTGGPRYSTSIHRTKSGRISANENWSMPLHSYNASHAVKKIPQYEQLLAFFHACGGMGKAFRFKDWMDYKSCPVLSTPSHTNQIIGVGNGTTTAFQMTKQYVTGSVTRTREIKKPVSGTILVGVNGSLVGSGFTIDYTTGIITFTVAPTSGQNVSWGGEFDVPAMFDSDNMEASIDDFENINTVLIVNEVRV